MQSEKFSCSPYHETGSHLVCSEHVQCVISLASSDTNEVMGWVPALRPAALLPG